MRIPHAPLDPPISYQANLEDTTTMSLSNSTPSLRGDPEEDDDDEPSLNYGIGKIEDEQELLSDEKDAIKSPRSLKGVANTEPVTKGFSSGNAMLRRGTERGTTSMSGIKNKITTTSKVRGLTSRGRSGKGTNATISKPAKTSSDIPDRQAEQDSLDDSSTNANQALHDTKDELAKMQRKLDRHQRKQQEFLAELRDYRDKVLEQERTITDLRNTSLEKVQLQEIVTDLQTKLLEESEEKKFWVSKCHEAHRDYSKNESEIRLLRAELADRDVLWKTERERTNDQLLIERDRCRERYHTAQKALQGREQEVHELRRQLLSLKHNISTWTKTEGQVADDVFMEKFTSLGHDLQNWTINNFRRAKIGVLCL